MGAGIRKAAKAQRREDFLEAGYSLFSEKGIDSVTLQDVADASGHGVATLYRYFSTKSGLLVEIANWKWGQFFERNSKRRPADLGAGTAADMFDFYLDSFLEVYRTDKPLLRFNQFLNIYIRSDDAEEGTRERYSGLMKPITDFVHAIYIKAQKDRTIRTDMSETEMLSATVHLMLAAVTRYAVGLVYEPEGFDDEAELEMLKEMLLERYRA